MGRLKESIEAREEPVTEARRHRVVSELRLPETTSAETFDARSAPHLTEAAALPAPAVEAGQGEHDGALAEEALRLADRAYLERRSITPLGAGALTDDLRATLWNVIQLFLFARSGEEESSAGDDGPWATSPIARPAVRRAWTAPPISGDPSRIPDDVSKLLEGWFSLVEPEDVYAFVETVHESLDARHRPRFATACNVALERGTSDHRFVVGRLVPVASKLDITTLERALSLCSRSALSAGVALEDAIAHLATKPEPDGRSAIQEAVRAVELAAFAITGERYLTLEDALFDLKERGIVDAAAEALHRGLFVFARSGTARQTTADGARRVLVMCAGLVTHLASRA